MVIDGGSVEIGLESTILDMTVEPPMILRPGAITADMFEEVIGPVSVDETILGSESQETSESSGNEIQALCPEGEACYRRGRSEGRDTGNPSTRLCGQQRRQKVGIIATDEDPSVL